MIRCFWCFFFFVFCQYIQANVSFYLETTDSGYWYAKAYNLLSNSPKKEDALFDVYLEATSDINTLSPRQLFYFLRNNELSIPTNLSHGNTLDLKVWKYIREHALKIPETDKATLRNAEIKLVNALQKYESIFEKLEKFWIVDNKKINFYCFLSTTNKIKSNISGAWLANYVSKDIHALSFLCILPIQVDSFLNDYLSVIAHELSHALCDIRYGRENFENIALHMGSKNSVIFGWYLNEILAIVIGNGLFQEAITGKRVDLTREEYCAKGLAPALYELTKEYIENSKSIDTVFIKKALQIFDTVLPSAYKDPRLCLYKVKVIKPDDIRSEDIIKGLQNKTTISSYEIFNLSELKPDIIKEIKNSSDTLMVLFYDSKSIKDLTSVIPNFNYNYKNLINIINKENKTYILMKLRRKHSILYHINALFKEKS